MEFFITLTAFAFFFFCLAVGLIFHNRRIKGSCGGLGAIFGKECDHCECRKGKREEDNMLENK